MLRAGLLVVGLIACKSKSSPPAPVAGEAGPPPADATAVAVPADAAAPDATTDAPAGALVARVDGVGPLGVNSRVDKQALVAAFPEHEIKKVSIKHGGDLRQDYLAVRKAGTLLLRVEGDGIIRAVEIVAAGIPNPMGVEIGATHAEVVKRVGPLDCENAGDDTDWRSQIAVCTTQGKTGDNYTLDFEGDDDAAALLADPALLAKAKLVAITWQAWIARGDRPF